MYKYTKYIYTSIVAHIQQKDIGYTLTKSPFEFIRISKVRNTAKSDNLASIKK